MNETLNSISSQLDLNTLLQTIMFSVGVATLPLDNEITLDQFIERADKALYLAKQKRNNVAFWDDVTGGPVLLGGND